MVFFVGSGLTLRSWAFCAAMTKLHCLALVYQLALFDIKNRMQVSVLVIPYRSWKFCECLQTTRQHKSTLATASFCRIIYGNHISDHKPVYRRMCICKLVPTKPYTETHRQRAIIIRHLEIWNWYTVNWCLFGNSINTYFLGRESTGHHEKPDSGGTCCGGGQLKKGRGWMKVVIKTIHKSSHCRGAIIHWITNYTGQFPATNNCSGCRFVLIFNGSFQSWSKPEILAVFWKQSCSHRVRNWCLVFRSVCLAIAQEILSKL